MRNRLSAGCMLVLPATASLARKLRLPAERSSSGRRADRKTGEPSPEGIHRRTKGALQASPPPGRRLLGKTSAPRSEIETSSALDSGKFRASRYLPHVSGGLRVDYDSASSRFSVPMEKTETRVTGTERGNRGASRLGLRPPVSLTRDGRHPGPHRSGRVRSYERWRRGSDSVPP